jgi:rare lipoprotein A
MRAKQQIGDSRMDRAQMTRMQVAGAARLALVLLGSASLAACASVATPKYSISERGQGGPYGGAQGSTVRPPSDSGAHGTNAPYQVGGIWYVPHEQPRYDETGIASWYGDAFNMKATANGEIFDMNQFSAAHTTLPLPSMVEVTNLDNGRKLVVRVNDRGPFVGGRLIDLSHAAAAELGYDRAGVAHVRVRYVGPAPLGGPEAGVRYAKASPPAYSPSRAAPIVVASAISDRRPADEDIFAETLAPTAAVAPLVPRPQPVSVSSLTPLPQAVRSTSAEAFVPASVASAPSPAMTPANRISRDPYISDVVAKRTPGAAMRPAPIQVAAQSVGQSDAPFAEHTTSFRIQAGAFSDELNAKKAADKLAAAGTATVEPFERSGVTFYRVYLPGAATEAEAYAVRDRVAAIGFADARVVRP